MALFWTSCIFSELSRLLSSTSERLLLGLVPQLLGHTLQDPGLPDVLLLLLLCLEKVELLADVCLHVEGAGGRVVAPHGLTLAAHQELLKVPRDVVLLDGGEVELLGGSNDECGAWTSSLEEAVERFLLCTITVGLASHSVVGNKSVARADKFQSTEDHIICTWLLQVEMIGGDGQNIKVGVVDFGLDCIPVYILLIQPSVGCRVEDDEDFPLVFVHVKHLPGELLQREVIDGAFYIATCCVCTADLGRGKASPDGQRHERS